MIKKNIVGLLFLLSVICYFNSCDEVYDEETARQDATYALCSNVWEDLYVNDDGYDCMQQITFFADGTGLDSYTTFYPNGSERYVEDPFIWRWTYSYFESLEIRYPNGDHSIMEDIWIGNRTLECLLDGYEINFKAVH